MKSGKAIDISKSSLVSLKAELLKKKEEALQSKGTTSFVRPSPKPKKKLKKNVGVEERSQRDELTEEEVDALQKSREVLEIKSKLYDKLQRGELVTDSGEDLYLVDFKDKAHSSSSDHSAQVNVPVQAKEDDNEPYSSDDESEWTDYIDCLGRTRRCLKTDLSLIKERDAALAERLVVKPPDSDSEQKEKPQQPSELVSADMQREAMRLKWEEQEKELANKKDIFYEDVRFDEARTHGVGYYALSTDIDKREEQLAAMRRGREETEKKQQEAAAARARRDAAKQARLVAARQRQRARLGLPPIDVSQIEEEMAKESDKSKDKEGEEKEEKALEDDNEGLEAQLKRAAHVRPWDIGKDGVKDPDPLMSQEEWVKKKREERVEEFAPPVEYTEKGKKKKKQKKKKRQRSESEEESTEIGPLPPFSDPNQPGPSWTGPDVSKPPPFIRPKQLIRSASPPPPSTSESSSETKRKGVEVPPPISFSFFTPETRRRHQTPAAPDMMSSIEAGLQFLRHQADKREKLFEDSSEEN